MHSYLKSIGFERIKCQSDVEQLLLFVVKHTQEEYRAELNEDILYGEFVLEVAEGIGIVVCGEYDKSGHFSVVHYFPYCKGRQISTDELVYVHKRVETNAFSAMCDDYRFGISLIFYLQNAVDYLKQKEKRKREPYTIYLSGLAREGKILLPTLKTEKQLAEKLTENIQRTKLIAEAREGNQEAIECLTMEDMDQYALVNRRIRKEDVYSIVDTSLVPYGSESDNYTVLGMINEVELIENALTKEEVYRLNLNCNGMDLDICINKKDLLGEPQKGRRFRGVVWLQGRVDFNRLTTP